MKRPLEILAAISVAIALGWLGYRWFVEKVPVFAPPPATGVPAPAADVLPPPPVQAMPPVPSPSQPPEVPSIVHPPADEIAPVPLPPLAESDADMRAALVELVPAEALAQFVQPEALARRFVATIDNLTAGRVSPQQRSVLPLGGRFLVYEADDGSLRRDPANHARYDTVVALVTGVDPARVVALYHRFHPLLQQAYEELGYPGRAFDDRLLAVIDHLLTAVPPPEPLRLVQPKVYYRYADPALEAASAGHKILFRLGPAHMETVQAWLRRVRTALTGAG